MSQRSPRLAIICAIPPERNTGMVSVDLAAHALLKRTGLQGALYVIGDPAQTPYQARETPYQYKDFRSHRDEVFESDAILFWGDFLHARSYWLNDRGHWGAGASGNTSVVDRALERAVSDMEANAFLLGAPLETLQRVITFGGTIITNNARDECDDRYRMSFERFFSEIGEALMRDAFSAAKLAPLRGGRPTLGCDCALLLRDEDLSDLKGFAEPKEKTGVGVFFGRSEGKFMMSRFAGRVARSLDEPAVWIPWFWTPRRTRAAAAVCGVDVDTHQDEHSPGALLAALASCKFVITDTYHVFVNAWRLGIPSVCIGRAGSGDRTSLADKKKETLAEMYGADPFYVFAEAWKLGGLHREVERARVALTDEAMVQRVRHNIAAHAAMAEERLSRALERVLAHSASSRILRA